MWIKTWTRRTPQGSYITNEIAENIHKSVAEFAFEDLGAEGCWLRRCALNLLMDQKYYDLEIFEIDIRLRRTQKLHSQNFEIHMENSPGHHPSVNLADYDSN